MKNETGKKRESGAPITRDTRFGALLTEPDTYYAVVCDSVLYPRIPGVDDWAPGRPVFSTDFGIGDIFTIPLVIDTSLANLLYVVVQHNLYAGAIPLNMYAQLLFEGRMIHPEVGLVEVPFTTGPFAPVPAGAILKPLIEQYELSGERITGLTLQLDGAPDGGEISELYLIMQRWREWQLPVDIGNLDEMPVL